MGRWEPNARGRLEQAALELYGEHGFEQTTVAEIAKRAGLTERTFFRHFADKREVLFAGSSSLRDILVNAVSEAPASTTPIDAIIGALEAAGTLMQERRDHSQQRQAVINANPELQERELVKLATLASAIAEALTQRGVPALTASVTAEAGIAVFKVAFEAWISGPGENSLPEHIRISFAELKTVTNA